MNAPVSLEALRRATQDARHSITEAGAQRWEWRHQFGTMVIEVQGGEVFVDQVKVVPVGRCPRPLGS